MGQRVVTMLGLMLACAGCDVALVRGLSREAAGHVLTVLDHGGVVGRAVPDDGTGAQLRVDVAEADVAEAVAALTSARERVACPAPAASNAWIETPGDERVRHAAHLESQLERSLVRLPDVVDAHVHFTPPQGMAGLPEAMTRPAASVLLVSSSNQTRTHELAVKELVAGAIPGMSPAAVRVVESRQAPAASAPQFARIGSIVVKRESLGTLKLWLALSLIVDMLLAAALLRPLLVRWWRQRRSTGASE